MRILSRSPVCCRAGIGSSRVQHPKIKSAGECSLRSTNQTAGPETVSRCPSVSARRCRGWYASPSWAGHVREPWPRIHSSPRHPILGNHSFGPRRSPGRILHYSKHSHFKADAKNYGLSNVEKPGRKATARAHPLTSQPFPDHH